MAGEVAHANTAVFGGLALLALPIIPSVAGRTFEPTGTMMVGIAILTLAAPAVASTLYRVLRPSATIWEELPSGERFEVERSTRARRIYLAIALAAYAVGALLCL